MKGVIDTINCDFMDMEDGGLWSRGVHPIDQSPHDWLRTTTAWLVRAATITFNDGTRHLTPGYPTHYNGTVRVFRQKYTLEDAIGLHAFAPLEALTCA
jgi:hypothetical protein